MSVVKVGKVAPIPKGVWSSTTAYDMLNMVNKGGSLYIAKRDVEAGTSVTSSDDWMKATGNLSIGTVTTVSSSTPADADIIDGTDGQILNLKIPRGVTGNESIDDSKGFGDTDYVWSANKIYNELLSKADAIEETLSGNIVTFSDEIGNSSIKTILTKIEPTQDLHGYDYPWAGGSKKNLLPSFDSGLWEECNTTSYNVVPSGNKVVFPFTIAANSYNPVVGCKVALSAGDYTISNVLGTYTCIQFYDSNDTSLGIVGREFTQGTFTAPTGTAYAYVAYSNYKGASDLTITLNTIAGQIESGTTATTYEPYSNICPISGWDACNVIVSPTMSAQNGTTVTINLSSTRYGGMLNVSTGVLMVDRVMDIFDGSNDETWTQASSTTDYYIDASYVPDRSKAIGGVGITNIYQWALQTGNIPTVRFQNYTPSSNSRRLYILYTKFQNLEELKSALQQTPLQVCYNIKAPFTVQLTPAEVRTILGVNNIWSDTGDVTVTYKKDIETYVDEKISTKVSADEIIDDTAGDNDTNVVWSADKSYNNTNESRNILNTKIDFINEKLQGKKEYLSKKFIINDNDLISGYINGNTGEYTSGTSSSGLCYCTDFIEIEGYGVIVNILNPNKSGFNILQYDENKTRITNNLLTSNTCNLNFEENTKYIRLSFKFKNFTSEYINIFFKMDEEPEEYIKVEWRNGSVTNTGNAQGISHKRIINNLGANKAYIIINKPLAEGHKYRYQYCTFDISSGNTSGNNSHLIASAVTFVSEKYIQEINLDDGSVGFGVAIYELDENDEYVPLRITNFDTDLIYIIRNWNIEKPYLGYTSFPTYKGVQDINLDTFTEPGLYTFNNDCTFINLPQKLLNRTTVVKVLKVYKVYTGSGNTPLYQEFTQPATGFSFIRYREGGGNWYVWKEINNEVIKSILFTNPTLSKIDFFLSKSKNKAQDIAIYNGNIFAFATNEMTINNGESISINCGHGNNAMFGKTLHGDFPYLYCGSWDYNDNYITVNEITSTTTNDITTYSVSTVRTITFSTLTGHLNMVVDEENDKIYILMNKDSSTHVGNINFVIAELSTGTILSQKDLDYAIPVIQGMEFHNGYIYVTHGGVSPDSESYISILNTKGERISISDPIPVGEIEGISFDNNTIYIANTSTIWY